MFINLWFSDGYRAYKIRTFDRNGLIHKFPKRKFLNSDISKNVIRSLLTLKTVSP